MEQKQFPDIEIVKGYEAYFRRFLQFIAQKELSKSLGEEVKKYALQTVPEINLSDFQQFSDDSYVRNYIGKDYETGWEALVMSWKKGNKTTIHGHPSFANYTILSGEILIETFDYIDNCLKPIGEYRVKSGVSFYAFGESDKFDNHIHRLTCLSDTAHSLHIYSDDARKGMVFEEK